METSTVAAQLERWDDETDTAWIERLRAHFAAERREQIRRDAERWADSDRQP
jgi:hypothetical protein